MGILTDPTPDCQAAARAGVTQKVGSPRPSNSLFTFITLYVSWRKSLAVFNYGTSSLIFRVNPSSLQLCTYVNATLHRNIIFYDEIDSALPMYQKSFYFLRCCNFCSLTQWHLLHLIAIWTNFDFSCIKSQLNYEVLVHIISVFRSSWEHEFYRRVKTLSLKFLFSWTLLFVS